ncbi:MAG: hypothetical protein AABX14_00220 [Candidatus Aenigmatarchaeota archaeon]
MAEKEKAEVSKSSVRQKIAAIKHQEKTNAAAVDKIYKGVAALQHNISEQEKINRAAVKEMDVGTRQIVSAINKMSEDFQAYTKEFWG